MPKCFLFETWAIERPFCSASGVRAGPFKSTSSRATLLASSPVWPKTGDSTKGPSLGDSSFKLSSYVCNVETQTSICFFAPWAKMRPHVSGEIDSNRKTRKKTHAQQMEAKATSICFTPHWLSGWPKQSPQTLYLPPKWSKPKKFKVHEPRK